VSEDRKFAGGHKTIDTGQRDEHGLPIYRHEPLSATEAETIWESVRRAHEDRVARMPDEKSALNAMHDAYTRLKDMGWRDAIYCPKDGSTFEIIEVGSTGIFRAHYQGEWPTGSWWAEDAGDLWPSRPALFRLLPEAQAEYDAKLDAARERWRAEHSADLDERSKVRRATENKYRLARSQVESGPCAGVFDADNVGYT